MGAGRLRRGVPPAGGDLAARCTGGDCGRELISPARNSRDGATITRQVIVVGPKEGVQSSSGAIQILPALSTLFAFSTRVETRRPVPGTPPGQGARASRSCARQSLVGSSFQAHYAQWRMVRRPHPPDAKVICQRSCSTQPYTTLSRAALNAPPMRWNYTCCHDWDSSVSRAYCTQLRCNSGGRVCEPRLLKY